MATTYKTVLFRFNEGSKTLDRGLTEDEARAICRDSDSSSRTCTDESRLKLWGNDPNNPWFIGCAEE